MKFLNEYKEGDTVNGIYLCKEKKTLEAKTGKSYHSLILQDKTKAVDGKVWEPNSSSIEEFETNDYIEVVGEMTNYNGAQQIKISRIRVCDKSEVITSNYMPSTTKDVDKMFEEIIKFKDSVKNVALHKFLDKLFCNDKLVQLFKEHSAAKKMHHAFVGGLLEHTLAVVKMCDYLASNYDIINRDLLITGALIHDIGKIKEISLFPSNDYTDAGQLLGHIVIGAEMIHDIAKDIPEFDDKLELQLSHMIISHHGEYEFGSPKKPAMIEALALNLADNTDAKIQMFKEFVSSANTKNAPWVGFSKIFESNIRLTEVDE